jgi:hypothetical protein
MILVITYGGVPDAPSPESYILESAFNIIVFAAAS